MQYKCETLKLTKKKNTMKLNEIQHFTPLQGKYTHKKILYILLYHRFTIWMIFIGVFIEAFPDCYIQTSTGRTFLHQRLDEHIFFYKFYTFNIAPIFVKCSYHIHIHAVIVVVFWNELSFFRHNLYVASLMTTKSLTRI